MDDFFNNIKHTFDNQPLEQVDASEIWKGVQEKMDKPKVWWAWWKTGILSLLCITGLFYFITQENKPTGAEKSQISTTLVDDANHLNQETNTTLDNTTLDTKTGNDTYNSALAENANISNPTNQNLKNDSENSTTITLYSAEKPIYSAGPWLAPKPSEFVKTTAFSTETAKVLPQSNTTNKGNNSIVLTEDMTFVDKPTQGFNSLEANEEGIASLDKLDMDLNLLTPTLEDKEIQSKSNRKSIKVKSPYHFYLTGGANYRQVKTNFTEGVNFNNLGGVSLGVDMQMNLDFLSNGYRKTYLWMGAHYQTNWEQLDVDITTRRLETVAQTAFLFSETADPVKVTTYESTMVSRQRKLIHYNQMQSISFPIHLQMDLNRKTALRFGILANWNLAYKGKMVDYIQFLSENNISVLTEDLLPQVQADFSLTHLTIGLDRWVNWGNGMYISYALQVPLSKFSDLGYRYYQHDVKVSIPLQKK